MEQYRILQAEFIINDLGAFIETIRRIGERERCSIICFDADRIAGMQHAEAALVRALRAQSSRCGIARSLEMEALLYASASRQCVIGAGFGVHAGFNRAFVAVVPPREGACAALCDIMKFVCVNWEEIDPAKKKVLMDLFAITGAELSATGENQLRALILERIALLEVNR